MTLIAEELVVITLHFQNFLVVVFSANSLSLLFFRMFGLFCFV